MPDDVMKNHFSLEQYSSSSMHVYDWQQDNRTQKNEKGAETWYNPMVKFAYEFYKKYDILPPRGWAFFESWVEYEESKKGTP